MGDSYYIAFVPVTAFAGDFVFAGTFEGQEHSAVFTKIHIDEKILNNLKRRA